MASSEIYGAPDARTAPVSANLLAAAAILGLFAISAVLSAPAPGFDELAHISYIAHIQSTGNLWPALSVRATYTVPTDGTKCSSLSLTGTGGG